MRLNLPHSEPNVRSVPAIDGGAIEAVAAHCRAAGFCLMLASADGDVLYHDQQAHPFFATYAVPALLAQEKLRSELSRYCGAAQDASAPQVWDFVPGVLLCATPYIERRQIAAICILIGRREDFGLSTDVEEICRALELDPHATSERAQTVIAHGAEHLICGMNLAQTILSDRLRVQALEGELRSLTTQLANTYEELSLIDQIGSGMRVNRSRSDFFEEVCLEVIEVICVRGMGVALRPDKTDIESALFGKVTLAADQLQRLSAQLLDTLQQRQSALLINEIGADAAYGWLAPHARQLIAVPLQRGEQVLGCLFGFDKLRSEFDSVDAKLLSSIANASAIYLQNAMLFADLHDLMMGLLHSLTSAVDAKDAYTCGHSERVALLSRHLAVKAGLSDTQVEHVYMAGLLHDVGKIGVPESVLQKTGRLTPEEYEQMKKHPRIGARILADVKQLEDVIPGVLYHHERYDGRGYPDGLAGQQIPLVGRIICLADCFDAMTSNRTYRKALPLEVALNEIRRCSGTQFDPALAEIFLQITPQQFWSLLHDHQVQAKKLLELQETLRAA